MINKITLVIITVILPLIKIYGQDAPISQYYYNMFYLNPAYAGMMASNRLNLFHRSQWLGYDKGFSFSGVSFDHDIAGKNSGLGVMLTNDINGTIITPSFHLAYAYRTNITKNLYMGFALQAGVAQKYQSYSGIEMLDTETLYEGYKKTYPDFAIAIAGYYKKWYFGIKLDHVTQPFMSDIVKHQDTKLSMACLMHIGYIHNYATSLIKQVRTVSPNILIMLHGYQSNITWGANYQYNKLVGGIWVRNNLQPKINTLIFSFGIRTKQYRLSYSYDISLFMSGINPGGTHEISITSIFETVKQKKHKVVKCPDYLL